MRVPGALCGGWSRGAAPRDKRSWDFYGRKWSCKQPGLRCAGNTGGRGGREGFVGEDCREVRRSAGRRSCTRSRTREGSSSGSSPGRFPGPRKGQVPAWPAGRPAGVRSASPGHRSPPRPRCAEETRPGRPHLSRYRCRGGRAAPWARVSSRGPCRLCDRRAPAELGPEGEEGAWGRAGQPGAGGDRRLLAAAVPPSPRGRRAPALTAEMPWGDAQGRCWLIPHQSRLKRDAGRRERSLAAPLALYCKIRWP